VSASRIVPGVTGQECVGFFRTPTVACVLINRTDVAENRIHHAPGRLDRILPGERDMYPFQGGTDQPIVRAHIRSRLQGEDQVIDLRIPAGAGLLADQLRPICASGQILNRNLTPPAALPSSKMLYGVGRKLISTSVAVTGIVFPARMAIGTPAHRALGRILAVLAVH
jgi:hypothetical protein